MKEYSSVLFFGEEKYLQVNIVYVYENRIKKIFLFVVGRGSNNYVLGKYDRYLYLN